MQLRHLATNFKGKTMNNYLVLNRQGRRMYSTPNRSVAISKAKKIYGGYVILETYQDGRARHIRVYG